MRVEVWTDVVCPYSWIGVTELLKAIDAFDHSDEVELVHRSFEIDPDAPETPVSLVEDQTARYELSQAEATANNETLAELAASIGLNFNWRAAQMTNSMDAHRVLQLARAEGKGDAAQARFAHGFFTDGEDLSDHETIVRLATEIGLDETRVREVLGSVEFAEQVHVDEQEAIARGITGVPFILFEGQWAVSGAQTEETFLEALETVKENMDNPYATMGGGCGCGGGGCGCGGGGAGHGHSGGSGGGCGCGGH
ncbi:hypothetical protein HMPREF1531_01421 [Propionibacterium sp. oral taxon 192 str. F0372]|uniref:DsbA family oxidoreductase n=1 Tax=Propionibacterium sp. oral taxon 192 TaxID=671222 RepID=UPI0003548DF1|nr:DsbA family oxidoreductase [Propionibacterium sp. oral taxon 192]EPH03362.1 hypothetical protein HMPREF1531_01421 [Propionibacterium sp. oral taxon 192 str. F0372]